MMKRIFAIAVILTLASAQTVGNNFLGQVENVRQLDDVSNECATAVTKIKILDITGAVVSGVSPATYQMDVYLDTDLTPCFAGQPNQAKEGIYHKVFFTRRSNEHFIPNTATNNNILPKSDATQLAAGKVRPTKFASDAAESTAAKTDFAYELFNKNDDAVSNLNGKTYQASWDEFVRTSDADAAVKFSFSYTFNNPMIEHLQTIGFYPTDVEMGNDKGGYKYEELPVFLMHTIWLPVYAGAAVNELQLSRWFEWFITVRTYTTLRPTNTQPATVIPVEIKAPICDSCVMTVTHTGTLDFYEERDATDAAYPTFPNGVVYRPNGDCDWKTTRDGLQFESLAKNVCFGIGLKDKTTSRAFVLQRLTYGYNGQRVSSKTLYDKFKDIKSSSLEKFTFDNTPGAKQLQIRLKFLKLGAVSELVYQAAVKLCKVTGTFKDNECDDLTVADATAAEAADQITTRLRMLEGHEPSRRRWLADKKKSVVQSYTTESTVSGQKYQPPVATNPGTGGGGGAGAVIGGVVALAAIGGIGFAVWKFGCQAKNAGGNGGNVPQNSQPNNNMQPTNNAV